MSEILSKESAIALCESLDLTSEYFDASDPEYIDLMSNNQKLWIAYGELYTLAYFDK